MKNQTNKQKIEKILKLVEKMEQNTFLLPESWSENMQMNSRSAHYRTYVGGRGDGRYINIEFTNNNELYNPKAEDFYSITIRKNNIYLNKRLGEKRNEVEIVLDIVEAIYKEKFSFEIMSKQKFEKRKHQKELRDRIKEMVEEFEKVKSELEDGDKLSTK